MAKKALPVPAPEQGAVPVKPKRDEAAYDKMIRARTALIQTQPFFGHLAMRLRLREGKVGRELPFPTVGTDGRYLVYDPDFVNALKPHDLFVVIAHEMLHIVLMHNTRVGPRKRMQWNCAADYAANEILMEAGLDVTKISVPELRGLHDAKYKGMTAEEIYTKLPKQMQVDCPQCGGDHRGEGDQQKDGGRGHSHDGPGNHNQQGCGGVLEPKDDKGNALSEADRRHLVHEFRGAMAQACQLAKAQGKLPAGIDRLVDEALYPKVDWRALLHRFFEVIARNDYDWLEADRNYMQRGIYVPTLHSKEVGEFAIIIDTSGSIGAQELSQFCGELSSILTLLRPQKIHVVYVDAAVAGSEEFGPDDLPLRLSAKGGGGTDFKPGFRWIEDNCPHMQAILYFTDMYCNSFPSRKPECPVLWVSTTADMEGRAPWGDVIHLELDRE